jgi:hypothetical protein
MPTIAHILYIPGVLLVGIAIGSVDQHDVTAERA